MNARTKKLLAFMLNAPDGKYEAPKPTDEQLAAVLPWLMNETVTWSRTYGHCDTVHEAIANVVGIKNWDGEMFYAADGLDARGRDKDGYDKDGYDRRGYNKDGRDRNGFDVNGYNVEGYSRRGYNKDGFNKDGRDQYGQTRQEAIAKLVQGWSQEHLAAIAAKLGERQAAAVAKAAEEAAAAETPAAEVVTTEELATASA